ncbi:hypothetical protein HanIR_Chr11g0548181 [Helianthus annuus]|nr:hypothetical protein HanIR_Chr11g0548181 [Helianthus annuus]
MLGNVFRHGPDRSGKVPETLPGRFSMLDRFNIEPVVEPGTGLLGRRFITRGRPGLFVFSLFFNLLTKGGCLLMSLTRSEQIRGESR